MSGRLRALEVGGGLRLPAALLTQTFARSGGKGGQNVNKVETKVELHLDLARAAALLGPARTARAHAKLANRIDAEGFLRVVCDEHRERGRNLATALVRMESLLTKAIVAPRPRRPTRPTRASKERRLADKQRRSHRLHERSRED